MKTLIFLFLLGNMGFHGEAAESLFSPDEIVWFGLDYSQVKFIGGHDTFSDLDKIQNQFFRSWNELVLMESDKYNVGGAFGVMQVSYEMEFAISRSEQTDMQEIIQTGSYSVDEELVKELVWLYTDTSDERIGALFVMESLDKLRGRSTMWLAVFNISTGEILHLKWYTGKTGGFGFRNYWARSYYNVLKSLKVSPRKPI
ncbi:MAG: hypothetical protein KAT15_18705 [Bacteroidales bacterium]|nr:hypothetical protein [Bacteroidales bacterium]